MKNSPGLWRRKMEEDFSYSARNLGLAAPIDRADQAGRSGIDSRDARWFKRVYLGLTRPRVYLWGEGSDSRLTASNGQAMYRWSVAQPFDVTSNFTVPVKGAAGVDAEREPVGLVDLQAGGWSFAARDVRGNVWVWGKLDGRGFSRGGWEDAHFEVEHPARIPLPARAVAIAQGRSHTLVLDADNLVWEMRAWGRAYQHTADVFTAPTQSGAGAPGRPPSVAQIAAGWEMSAVLTSAGDIHVWFPFAEDYALSTTPNDDMSGPVCIDGANMSRMFKWGKVASDVVVTVPAIPERPSSVSGDHMALWPKHEGKDAHHVIKIACGRDFVVALRRNGEVWAARASDNTVSDWEYLEHFSLPSITHVSAQFTTLASYSTPLDGTRSQVLLDRVQITPGCGSSIRPQNVPGLADLPIVQVIGGDWHWVALTSRGEVYTWGENGQGQLGDGSRTARQEPTRVSFPPAEDGREAFAFAITAAGMQTGALVLGYKLKGGVQREPRQVPVPAPRSPLGLPGMRGIRIGLAGGRGTRGGPSRGGGAGRGASDSHLGATGGLGSRLWNLMGLGTNNATQSTSSSGSSQHDAAQPPMPGQYGS